VLPSVANAQLGVIDHYYYKDTDAPYGISYPEWTARFWQWFASIPDPGPSGPLHPMRDPTGERCGVSQSGPVWFLTGGLISQKTERTCLIPAGKAILVPYINVECNTGEDRSLTTKEALLDCARTGNDGVENITGSFYDGHQQMQFPSGSKYRIPSSIFNITFPDMSVFPPAEKGTYPAASDGYWIFLKPLATGNYTLTAGATQVVPPSQNPSGKIFFDFTYHLVVR